LLHLLLLIKVTEKKMVLLIRATASKYVHIRRTSHYIYHYLCFYIPKLSPCEAMSSIPYVRQITCTSSAQPSDPLLLYGSMSTFSNHRCRGRCSPQTLSFSSLSGLDTHAAKKSSSTEPPRASFPTWCSSLHRMWPLMAIHSAHLGCSRVAPHPPPRMPTQ